MESKEIKPAEAMGNRPDPFVSVVICCWNEAHRIADCLQSVLAQQYPSFEVIVVDDGSVDDTFAIARRVLDSMANACVLRTAANRGAASARNQGIENSTGDVIVFLDADTRVPGDDWLSSLVGSVVNGLDCVGGPDIPGAEAGVFERCVDYSMHSLIGSGGLRTHQSPFSQYLPASCNVAVTRRALDAVGLFNESFHSRGEDKELFARVRNAGFSIGFNPNAVIIHHRPATLRDFFRQSFTSGVARYKLSSHESTGWSLPHLLPAAWCVYLTLCILVLILSAPFLASFVVLSLIAYGAVLLGDAMLATVKLRDLRAAVFVPVTSATLPIAYGLGTLKGLVTLR